MNEILSDQEKLDRELVCNDPYSIQRIKNPSEAVQLIATSNNGYVIEHIQHPSENVQLRATSQTGYAIKYIETPSDAVQHNAISQTLYSIQYIKNPCPTAQILAVGQNGRALIHIKNPTLNAILKAIEISPFIIFDDRFFQKITPQILDVLHLGLANQVELIKSLSDNVDDRVNMLTSVLPMFPVIHNTHLDPIDLPDDLGL
jgi:hypothetical protein